MEASQEPLNMTSNVAFRAFFKGNDELLISILQDFLPLPEGYEIESVVLMDGEETPEKLRPEGKTSIGWISSVTARPLAIGFVAFLVAFLRRTKSTPSRFPLTYEKYASSRSSSALRLSSKGLAVTGGASYWI